ncbi:MAG: hypothetical protein ABSF45_24295 [Terriglobia bacterium]
MIGAPGRAARQVTGWLIVAALCTGLGAPVTAGWGAQKPPAPGAESQKAGQLSSPDTTRPPTVALSPSVVMAKGIYGQGITEQLTLSNFTRSTLAFEMVAQDVVVKDGKRDFAPAGETRGGIAASAVFSPREVVVEPDSSVTAQVTFTIPPQTDLRAVVAIFRGKGIVATQGSVGMIASLGTLFVFTLSDNFKIEASPVSITPQTNSSNVTFNQWLTNTGSEPLLPEGAAAILNEAGALVGKVVIQSQRLLPGEKLLFKVEYSTQLDPGHYKVLVAFQYEGKTLTSSQDFTVQ